MARRLSGRAASEIEREAVALGPIKVGDTVGSGAGRLKAKHVVLFSVSLRRRRGMARPPTEKRMPPAA